VLDLFSRFVVGWTVSAVNDRPPGCPRARHGVEAPVPGCGTPAPLRSSSPYASEDYQIVFEARGITCRMSRRGNCYDNAVMESFLSTVKSELRYRFDSRGEAKMELFDFIEVFYNGRRRHSALGQISAAAFDRRAMTRAA
jgi:putative transposase